MIIFSIQKRSLSTSLKPIYEVSKKQKKAIYLKSKITILKKKFILRMDGFECEISCVSDNIGSFEVYFMDFYDVIKSNLKGSNTIFEFILTERELQLDNRKISVLSSEFKTRRVKKELELPINSLDYIKNEDDILVKNTDKEYSLLVNKAKKFIKTKIDSDINKSMVLLGKYDVTLEELEKIVYTKFFED
jgi:hypothetical protein